MHYIESQTLELLKKFNFKSVLLACSGGSDSTALLTVFKNILPSYDMRIEVVTIDHSLRPSSSSEADFVRRLSEQYGFRHHLIKLENLKNKSENHLRNQRIKIFENLLNKRNLQITVLGHTADDQAETVIMRLIRGSGTEGLSGIKTLNNQGFRPLLNYRRQELRTYLSQNNQTWIEDESNFQPVYFRNRVRNEIIPLLHKENPQIIKTLCTTAEIMARDAEIINSLTQNIISSSFNFKNGRIFSISRTLRYGEALLFHVIKQVWKEFSISEEINAKHLNSAVNFIINGSSGKQIKLPSDVIIIKFFDNFYIGAAFKKEQFKKTMHTVNDEVEIPRGIFKLQPDANGEIRIPDSSFPVTIRTRMSEDRLSRKHMGNVKLSKLMKTGIPEIFRDELIVIEGKDGVIEWVEHLGSKFIENYESIPKYKIVWIRKKYELPENL